MLQALIKDLKKVARPAKARILARFFKTGKGEYGEGDVFWGVMVPEQRRLVKKYHPKLTELDTRYLLDSAVHELRLIGCLVMVAKYEKGDEREKKKIVGLYLKNLKKGRINNWDLVDLSAPKILGDYLFDKSKDILYNLAVDKSLWLRRVAIVSTLSFIRRKRFFETLKISKILISDKEDLVHKAVGWLLREVGKKDEKVLKNFLDQFSPHMPRTMLRYAIEKFEKENRIKYLAK